MDTFSPTMTQQIAFTTGTMVQVLLLVHRLPGKSWNWDGPSDQSSEALLKTL